MVLPPPPSGNQFTPRSLFEAPKEIYSLGQASLRVLAEYPENLLKNDHKIIKKLIIF